MPKHMSDPIWTHWTDVIVDGKKSRVECKYCQGHNQLKNAPKCKAHTIKCSKAPNSVRNRFRVQMDVKKMLQRKGIKKRVSLKDDVNLVPVLDADTGEISAVGAEEDAPNPICGNDETEAVPEVYENYTLVSIDKNYSSVKPKRSYNQMRSLSENLINDSVVRYIDAFYRIKEDLNYLLNETTVERKREFLSFALEVIDDNMTEEDKIALNQEIVEINGN